MEDLAKKMAELFDSDQSKSFDEQDYANNKNDSRLLKEKLKDLNLIVDREPEEKIEDVKIPHVELKEEKIENKEEKNVILTKHESLALLKDESIEEDENTSEEENEENESDDILSEAENDPTFNVSPSNPLNFSGKDLENYNFIKKNYSERFDLGESNPSMIHFYRFKLKELGYLLGRSNVVEFDALTKELSNMIVDNTVHGIPHGEVIADKLNKIIRQRDRFSEIMISVHKQFPMWKSSAELLRGKLWCIKDVKGQHKREGIVADHMSDIMHYVSELESLVDVGKIIDNMLTHAQDSLSRQLSCVQDKLTREPTVWDTVDNKEKELDTSEVSSSEVSIETFGNEFDELENIG